MMEAALMLGAVVGLVVVANSKKEEGTATSDSTGAGELGSEPDYMAAQPAVYQVERAVDIGDVRAAVDASGTPVSVDRDAAGVTSKPQTGNDAKLPTSSGTSFESPVDPPTAKADNPANIAATPIAPTKADQTVISHLDRVGVKGPSNEQFQKVSNLWEKVAGKEQGRKLAGQKAYWDEVANRGVKEMKGVTPKDAARALMHDGPRNGSVW